MKRIILTNKWFGTLVALSSTAILPAQEKPNIVLILADDMGYSDLGCYGGEIETPNLDSLARKGIRYSHFYNGARSCPTRAALMTGLFAHQAGIGWMTNAHEGDGAYEGDLSRNALTIAEYLKEGGYKTYVTGKWHLVSYRKVNHKVKDNWPLQRGFDGFYGIIDGATNYFTTAVNIGNNDGVTQSDPNFYFTDAISDESVEFIENNGNDPFFMYVAYNAPHWPLQAKQADIDKYLNKYNDGWDELRKTRFAKQKEIGLFDNTYDISARDNQVVAWDDISTLTDGDRSNPELWTRRMAIYAAQIDAMDQGIGRIVQSLKDAGKLDNTLILFLSDNGACAEPLGSDLIANMTGGVNKNESYRRPWANVSSTPFREYKHHAHEGGINTPLIVHWPEGVVNADGRIVRSTGHIIDIFKTIEKITGISYPETYVRGDSTYRIVPLQGESLLPDFKDENKVRGPMFWEHEGNLAVRMGEWKLVVKTPENQSLGSLELYNMVSDPIEENDLSASYPQKLKELWDIWYEWAMEKNVFPLRYAIYADRQSEDKRYPNGTFDEYQKAGWLPEVSETGTVAKWKVDQTSQITGQNSARVEIIKTGTAPANYNFKWTNLQLKAGERCKVRFKAKADKATSFKLRLEKDGDGWGKVIDLDVAVGTEIKQYEFYSSVVPADFKYQIGFYVGHCAPGVIWFDDVELNFINKESLSPTWNLKSMETGSYNVSFDGATTYTGIDNFPVPVKVSLKRKNEPQSVYHSETFFITKDKKNISFDVSNPSADEQVYIEFEFPPYASLKCLIENPTLKFNKSSSTSQDKTDDYQIQNIGNAILIKPMNHEINYSVEIFNMSGSLAGKYTSLTDQMIVPVSVSGVYIIKVNEGDKEKKVQKISIN
ncbi:MAG: sulfatase-like hydrolase/transferase [Paludibacteraceae bacterium]